MFDDSDFSMMQYDCDAIAIECGIVGKLDSAKLLSDHATRNKNLKWVHTFNAGIDMYLKYPEFVNADHIQLTRSKSVFGYTLAEFVLMNIITECKKLRELQAQQARKEWKQLLMEDPGSKHLVIIGFGDIGLEVAKMVKRTYPTIKVTGVKRDPENLSEEQKKYADNVIGTDKILDAVKSADFVTSVLPFTEGNHKVLNKEVFASFKEGSTFINIGRGKTVDEDALLDAVKNGPIKSAALDVTYTEPLPQESGLWTEPNILIYPHTADVY